MSELAPILEVKERGNEQFRNKEYHDAVETYTEAIFMAETTRFDKSEEEEEIEKRPKVEVVEPEEDGNDNTDNKSENEEENENKEENKKEEKPKAHPELDELKAILYGNRAACYKMLEDANSSLPDCDHALALKTPNPKVRTRRSWALRKQGKENL